MAAADQPVAPPLAAADPDYEKLIRKLEESLSRETNDMRAYMARKKLELAKEFQTSGVILPAVKQRGTMIDGQEFNGGFTDPEVAICEAKKAAIFHDYKLHLLKEHGIPHRICFEKMSYNIHTMDLGKFKAMMDSVKSAVSSAIAGVASYYSANYAGLAKNAVEIFEGLTTIFNNLLSGKYISSSARDGTLNFDFEKNGPLANMVMFSYKYKAKTSTSLGLLGRAHLKYKIKIVWIVSQFSLTHQG